MTINAKILFTLNRITKSAGIALLAALFALPSARAQNKLSRGEHFAQINGIRIHYYVRGKGPVCLLPSAGWGIPIQYIMPLPVFEKHFTMVYYDTRLSGKSEGPSDPLKYKADDFMQDMDSLRVFLGQQKIWLAGHSMGGFQVLNYAVQHNEKLNGLIVMSSIIKFDSVRTKQYVKLIEKRRTYTFYLQHPDIYDKAVAVMRGKDTVHYPLKEKFLLTGCLYCHDGALGQKYFSRIDFRDTVDRYIGASGFYGKDVFSQLSKITAPTFVICGDDDFICDHISQSDRIHGQIKSSELVILKNCGHMLWIEQPEAFNSAFEDWFRKQHL